MDIINAVVAEVKIGDNLLIEGLKLDDGRLAIAVGQVAKLFQFPIKHSSRDIKALLGAGFQFTKIKAERATKQNRPENALLLDFK